ncbi:MAG TPA: hypothetical protein VLV89_03475 [Candidatus Acidoferrum sp.]|nr:hypothetical protein [Candidatus Acidoferrum sp.]
MNRALMVMIGVLSMLVVGAGGPATRGAVREQGGQAIDALSRPGVARATVDQFAWEAGKWVGMDGTNTAEQICDEPSHHEMTCMYREMDAENVTSVQIWTLREVPIPAGSPGSTGGTGPQTTLVERLRIFLPDMKELPLEDGITLKMTSATATEFTFENAKEGGMVVKGKLTRVGDDEFKEHNEYVGTDGKASTSDTTMKRVK